MTRKSVTDDEDVECAAVVDDSIEHVVAAGANDSNAKPRKPLTLTVGSDSLEVDAATDDDGTLFPSENSTSDRWGPSTSTWMILTLVLVLGFAVAAAFLGVGIAGNNKDQQDQFVQSATDIVNSIQYAWLDYKNAAALIHNRCRSRNFTRDQFRNLYEYLIDGGLDFQAAQFDPNITDSERASAEAEAASYYATYYPQVNYRGFVGFETENSTTLEPRSKHAFYFPIHYMEPILGNEAAIDLDYYASGSRRRTVLSCMETGQPALTDRLRLVQETQSGDAYGVVLMHPGVNLTSQRDVWPRDLASIVIRIQDLLRRSVEKQGASSLVYIYDSSDTISDSPTFLGGVHVDTTAGGDQAVLQFLPEIELYQVYGHLQWQDTVTAANKIWIVLVAAPEGTYQANNIFVVMGGVIICVASISLAVWICTNARRVHRFNDMKAQAEAEKTALILDSANQATKAERELNDFIAHEVRNPVAAAMSACSFVQTAIRKPEPVVDPEARQTLREDVEIIDNALKFVNDLLRNMLDMHRAANKQLIIDSTPTDLLHDVLEPVQGMLHYSGSKVNVIVECPKDLVILSDHLRLKQVILNLGRNSVKFIEEGFIKMQAHVVDGQVQIAVEDSGPGIPLGKRENLFCKYQESLDMLSQGTGIGLFLCKNLVELMGGDIRLDEHYNSGIPGCPGTRFVIDLKVAPIDPNEYNSHVGNGTLHDGPLENDVESSPLIDSEMPESLNVLFVDDDQIMRKLFARTIKTVAPGWTVRQAANGETALKLIETDHYDLIFMDMYMASVEKQMLGTEAVQALRAKGVMSRICGLSANDKEADFLSAGADAFTFKPFPCEKVALSLELLRILNQDRLDGHGSSVVSETR